MSSIKPVTTATVGLGGYGGAYLRAFEEDAASSQPHVKFVAAMSSNLAKHADVVAKLQTQGVKCVESYEELLALPVEAVWLPLPIDLHRPFTEQALAAGKAVMCEKPAAGCIDDVNAMIAARDKYKLPVAIGYQDVYDPTTMPTKRRLLDGAVGQVSHATLYACWPRDNTYYGRASWSGAVKRNGVWVMDSPANNALAHYINITLFLLGRTLHESALPVAVEAELYRVNPVENFDTIAMRVTLDGGVTFQVMLTHACERQINPIIEIHGSRGSIRRVNESVTIKSGDKEEVLPRGVKPMNQMLRRFTNYVRGVEDDTIGLCTLEVARAQLIAVNGASEATAVKVVDPAYVHQPLSAKGGTIQAIKGIEDAFEKCTAKQQLLHESGTLPWTSPAGKRDLRGYRTFAGPK